MFPTDRGNRGRVGRLSQLVIGVVGFAACVKTTHLPTVEPSPIGDFALGPLPDGRYLLTATVDSNSCPPGGGKWLEIFPSQIILSGVHVYALVDGHSVEMIAKRNDHGQLVVPAGGLDLSVGLSLSYNARTHVDGTWVMEPQNCETTWHLRGHRVPN